MVGSLALCPQHGDEWKRDVEIERLEGRGNEKRSEKKTKDISREKLGNEDRRTRSKRYELPS